MAISGLNSKVFLLSLDLDDIGVAKLFKIELVMVGRVKFAVNVGENFQGIFFILTLNTGLVDAES